MGHGDMGHGDRYIGSLFRVDEPVPDDSNPAPNDSGGGKSLSIGHIAFHSHVIIINIHCSIHNLRSYFSCKSTTFL